MMTFIADRLAEYGIKSLRVNNCTVRVAEPMNTVLGFWPVVVIESDQVSDNHNCPACGSGICGYLSGDEVITVMCRACGAIYKLREASADEDPGGIG